MLIVFSEQICEKDIVYRCSCWPHGKERHTQQTILVLRGLILLKDMLIPVKTLNDAKWFGPEA